MILIVGLGNPGKKYEKNRHNVGFMALDEFAKNEEATFKFSEKFNADLAETTITFPGEKKHVRVMLAKPQTYMNNSGDSVSKLVNFYKLRNVDQLWVIHDDLDIELGTIRIRLNGSSAGQKGVESIIKGLGTDHFVRFRIGIRPKDGQLKAAEDFVLENFDTDERKIIDSSIKKTLAMVIESCDKGIIGTSI